VLYSDSYGRGWAATAPAATDPWVAVAFGNMSGDTSAGTFVAVANNGSIMSSPDGVEWTFRTAATFSIHDVTSKWTSWSPLDVVSPNDLFVAVGSAMSNDGVYTSPDGVDWTPRTTPTGSIWTAVCYGNGMFVAVAAAGGQDHIMTSSDGINWAAVSAPDLNYTDIAYGEGRFVATPVNAPGVLVTSVDGQTWERIAAPVTTDAGYSRIIYGLAPNLQGNRWMALAASSGFVRIILSTDGVNWVPQTDSTGSPTNVPDWQSIAYDPGPGSFVAMCSSYAVKFSQSMSKGAIAVDSIQLNTAGAGLPGQAIVSSTSNPGTLEWGDIKPVLQLEVGGNFQHPYAFQVSTGPTIVPATTTGLISLTSEQGVSIQKFDYSETLPGATGGITGINFSNLTGVIGDFKPNNLSYLQSLLLPSLKFVGGDIAPTAINLGNIDFPVLQLVGGSFSFNTVYTSSITAPSLQRAENGVYFNSCFGMSTLDLSNLTFSAAFEMTTQFNMFTLNLPALSYVAGGVSVSGCENLSSVSFPVLTECGTITISSNPALSSIDFNSLTRATVSISMIELPQISSLPFSALTYTAGLNVVSCAQIANIELPVCVYMQDIAVTGCTGATMISMPLATDINNVSMSDLPLLETISFPSTRNLSGIGMSPSAAPALANVTLGVIGVIKQIAAGIDLQGCNLTQTTVDEILAMLVSLDGTNGTTLWGTTGAVRLNLGTSSAPSAQGLIDKATLEGRGAVVEVNA
jgi:hypothetical protein